MSCDYSDAVGWPAPRTRVYKVLWTQPDFVLARRYQLRKLKAQAWYRALRARGSLR